MFKIKIYLFVFICIFFQSLEALPRVEEIQSGEVVFATEGKNFSVTTSEKAIIHYKTFDIGEGELVEFFQPSKDSAVLNRVVGGKESEILGRLKGNGRIFLVNPDGVYFGPNGSVNANAFLATTLSIKDDDFLNDRYEFTLKEGTYGQILNEGSIYADEFVALFASTVQNRGNIVARLDKVFVGAAEKFSIDFSGDGLVRFQVDGELEEALIENYGKIESANGEVLLSIKTAKKAIQSVINTDGIEVASKIEEIDGVIRLLSGSEIIASCVTVEANQIELKGAVIDVSKEGGGGEIYIGGDYQGKGSIRTAAQTFIDEESILIADAYGNGDGGKVIVWADDFTRFDGKIYARGGELGGNGGFVETSGKETLVVGESGHVNTSASKGSFGDWLLDPDTITISSSGSGTIGQAAACSTIGSVTISTTTLQAATSNLVLCAQNNMNSSITLNNVLTLPAGISLSMTAGSTNNGTIHIKQSIVTLGQPINLIGNVSIEANTTLDTTRSNSSPNGADITILGTINATLGSLKINGGLLGVVNLPTIGDQLSVDGLTVTGSAINLNGSMAISGAINFNGPVNLATNLLISTDVTATGSNINFSSTIDGAVDLTIAAGTHGVISLPKAVGGVTPLSSLTITGKTITQSSSVHTVGIVSYEGITAINLAGNITTNGGEIGFIAPCNITGASTLNTTNSNPSGADISFSSTINGANNLTLNGGTGGAISFPSAIGGTTPLSSLTVVGGMITQSSTVKTTGAVIYSATSNSINGNITTSGGSISITGPATLAATSIDTTNGGATTGGANITFSSTVDGAVALALKGGTGGIVTLSGVIGASTPLSSLTVIGSSILQRGDLVVRGLVNFTAPNGISLQGNITPNQIMINGDATLTDSCTITTGGNSGEDIDFVGTIDGNQALTLVAGNGNINLSKAVGGIARLADLTIRSASLVATKDISAASITQSAGSGTTTFGGNLNTNGLLGIDLTGASFNFNGNITTTAGSFSLTNSSNALFLSGISFSLGGPFTQLGAGSTFIGGTLETFDSNITFIGPIYLSPTQDLIIKTNGGDFIYTEINGAIFENITIDTGVGRATLGSLPLSGTINILLVTGGDIVLNGPLDVEALMLEADNSIFNQSISYEITSNDTAFLNAIDGDVGSLNNPIWITTNDEIIVGGVDLAVINGSSFSGTVLADSSNPPCIIYFNNKKIKDCISPSPPPTPTPPSPTPPSPSAYAGIKGGRFIAVNGVYNSQITLSDDDHVRTLLISSQFLYRPRLLIFVKT